MGLCYVCPIRSTVDIGESLSRVSLVFEFGLFDLPCLKARFPVLELAWFLLVLVEQLKLVKLDHQVS